MILSAYAHISGSANNFTDYFNRLYNCSKKKIDIKFIFLRISSSNLVIVWLLSLLLFPSMLFAQIPPSQSSAIFQVIKPVEKEFDIVFKSEKDLGDLVRLKDFIQTKEGQLKEFSNTAQKLHDTLTRSNQFSDIISNADAIFKSIPALEQISSDKNIGNKLLSAIPIDKDLKNNLAFQTIEKSWSPMLSLNNCIGGLRTFITDVTQFKSQYDQVNSNIQNIASDLGNAEEQVQRIFDINNNLNQTKLWISLTFSVIILALLGFFFSFLFKISNEYTARLFLTGNGIQFIALFALIISIVLFGVLGILEGRELAAILSGISGFILGKGIVPTEQKNPLPGVTKNDTGLPTDN